MANLKKQSGFDFVEAGKFIYAEEPYKFKNWQSNIKISFIDDRFRFADETAYFLTVDSEIVYAGEFTYNFKDRWLSKDYVNHHMYRKILDAVLDNKSVTIWLAISPYLAISGDRELNVSKAIEQQLIKDCQPIWNSRNKHSNMKEWRSKNCIRIDSFIKTP